MASCEGLMAKALVGEDSSYIASKRSDAWLKVWISLSLGVVLRRGPTMGPA